MSSAILASGAHAAETYVSLGLGVAEERVEMNSLLPGFSTCYSSFVSSAASVDFCGGSSAYERSGAEFDLENSLAGSASVGFEWENWRLELEYSGREHGGRSLPQLVLPLAEQFSGIDFGAPGGFIGFPFGFPRENPKHEISRLNSQQLFVNAFYSFRTGVAWRPFVGLGVGMARIQYRYRLEGSELAFRFPPFDPIPIAEELPIPQLFSFTNRTVLDAESSDNVLGYQFMAGIDRELTDRVTAFASLRWSRFEASEVSNLGPGQPGSIPALSLLPVITSTPESLDDIGGVSLIAGIRFSF
ncbi:MAG: hypothetical protein F4Y22_11675 [Gammaproteobacteria bacterium]|nr:hypothetical protein [Gammaproteobacteria bacterium]